MNKTITGDEHVAIMTIRQEAILRFMVAFSNQFIYADSTAEKAEKWADAYIDQLNKSNEDKKNITQYTTSLPFS